MGLDMYLRAQFYIPGYSHNNDPRFKIIIDACEMQNGYCKESPSLRVLITVAYWRKANAIHRWFVNNVQDGKDECQAHYVSREQLTALRDLCLQILEHKSEVYASEKLPPFKGFFFGSDKVDADYFSDLELTVKQINKCLELSQQIEFYYQSSW